MSARFEAVAGLDEMVALMVAPEVRKVADDVRDTAKKLAPQTKKWITRGDGRVRASHVVAGADAFNFNAPENLRFRLPSMEWDMADDESNHLPEDTWMEHPQDWSSRAVANILDCRCTAIYDKDVIRKTIRTGPTQMRGPGIKIEVSATGNRIVESEYGEAYTGPVPAAVGLHWMGGAAAAAAARGRARR